MWLATDTTGRWHVGIGDPTLIGWFTVLAYALAGLLCAGAAWAVRQRPDSRLLPDDHRQLRLFWVGVGCLMGFLALNKQLDLQTLLTQIGKDMAHEQGWYDARRTVQGLFVKTIGLLAVVAAAVISWNMRRVLRQAMLSLLGLIALLAFIVIRAASFHKVDLLLRSELLGIRTNGLFELGGIALVAMGAWRAGGGNAPLFRFGAQAVRRYFGTPAQRRPRRPPGQHQGP